MKKLLCKLGLHNYKLSHDTGINRYYECKWCNKRIVKYIWSLRQPIDRDWLNNIT